MSKKHKKYWKVEGTGIQMEIKPQQRTYGFSVRCRDSKHYENLLIYGMCNSCKRAYGYEPNN
jgi:hypothetical protein